METWPIFLAREMYNDGRPPLRPGSEIAWNVVLTDGADQDWPKAMLVDLSVDIVGPPKGARRGNLAQTEDFSLCWQGAAPIGSRVELHGLIVADWFNPPFQTTVFGHVQRLCLVTRRSAKQSKRICLTELPEQRGTLQAHLDERDEAVIGLLAQADVASVSVSAFPSR
jgi:hypothetical protein